MQIVGVCGWLSIVQSVLSFIFLCSFCSFLFENQGLIVKLGVSGKMVVADLLGFGLFLFLLFLILVLLL